MPLQKTLALSLVMVALALSPTAMAEWHPAKEPAAPQGARDSRTDRMARDLNLTKAQREKLEKVYQDRDRRLKSLYDDFHSKREAVKDETDGKIEALLTSEQREKLKEMQRKKLVERTKNLGEKDHK